MPPPTSGLDFGSDEFWKRYIDPAIDEIYRRDVKWFMSMLPWPLDPNAPPTVGEK